MYKIQGVLCLKKQNNERISNNRHVFFRDFWDKNGKLRLTVKWMVKERDSCKIILDQTEVF